MVKTQEKGKQEGVGGEDTRQGGDAARALIFERGYEVDTIQNSEFSDAVQNSAFSDTIHNSELSELSVSFLHLLCSTHQ